MVMEIYEGFNFSNFTDSDYTSANLTTHLTFPHQIDFDKHKFQDTMLGDVLVAGLKQSDGTVLVTDLITKDINSASNSEALVNKNTLETGGLVGLRGLSQGVHDLFHHKLLSAKGNVANFTILHQDPKIKDGPHQTGISLSTYAQGVRLNIAFKTSLEEGIYKYVFDLFFPTSKTFKIYLYGDCGENGYTGSTYYEHWSTGSTRGTNKETDFDGAMFQTMYGTNINISGEFRYTGSKIKNYGTSLSINQAGAYNLFVLQEMEKKANQAVLLGKQMIWKFENATSNDGGLTLGTDSYFYLEHVHL